MTAKMFKSRDLSFINDMEREKIEDGMARLLFMTGRKANKIYMGKDAFLALGGDPDDLPFVTNEDGVVEINPTPKNQEKIDGV